MKLFSIIFLSCLTVFLDSCRSKPGPSNIVNAPNLTVSNQSKHEIDNVSLVSGDLKLTFGVLGIGASATVGYAYITNNPEILMEWEVADNGKILTSLFHLEGVKARHFGSVSHFEFIYQGGESCVLKVYGPVPKNALDGVVVETVIGEFQGIKPMKGETKK